MKSCRPMLVAAVALLSMLSFGAFAQTQMVHFKAHLAAASEVPPNDGAGTGDLEATLDPASDKLTWHVTYAGLSGPATMAHFHGPAMPGANAGVVVPIKGALTSPIDGEATLTPEQAADLMAGKWYFNVHTAAHPGGEIRGQVEKQ